MASSDLRTRILGRLNSWQNNRQIQKLAHQVALHNQNTVASPGNPDVNPSPIVSFIVSARLTGLSQNSAFSMLAGWGLRLAGMPVVHFVCQGGMSHCVLGTNRQNFRTHPPCDTCIAQSRTIYSEADIQWFKYQRDNELAQVLQLLSVDELAHFSIELNLPWIKYQTPIPLGQLALPAIRWALRRHTLPDDEQTRYLLREYILSAFNIAREFSNLLNQVKPSAVVIFNGIMFPEATASWVARQQGIRTITHEVGFQRLSAFYSEGEATAYPIEIPEEFELNTEQNKLLDAYLQKRFQGQFTMAGIRFWPEMRGLDTSFLQKASKFQQIVPVFTNVVYDTSQVHANQIYPHMFAWLNTVLDIIRAHPETLFVIRAHPDEMRPGTAKQSQESVRDWVIQNGVNSLSNVVFIDSQEYISSYELIQRAKFIIVYNSSIGMEAALMGAAVLCGGKARYTQYPMVFFPSTQEDYRAEAEKLLEADGKPTIPAEFQRNARRFLYYQLFRASLSFETYSEDIPRKGFVKIKPFSWDELLPENSTTIRTLAEGISGKRSNFLLEDTQ